MSSVAYLYKIVNLVNDKIYVGVTKYPEKRFREHCHKNSSCTKLKRAIAKHGKENFKMVILCQGSEEYIIDMEEKAISTYDSLKNGYNSLPAHHSKGLTLPEEVVEKMRKGLAEYYKHNSGWNLGKKWESHPNDVACYVLGFWFPNKRCAVKHLKISSKNYYHMKDKEEGQRIYELRCDDVKYSPCYVGGFWFPSRVVASEALKVRMGTINSRISRGNVEASNGRTRENYTKNCSGAGKFGALSPKSKPVCVDGINYAGIAEAVRQTSYTESIICKGLKKGDPRFQYINKIGIIKCR
jgi:group I intron endonuclease